MRLSETIRKLHLLQTLDALAFGFNCLRYMMRNRRFVQLHPDYPLPPPALAYDAFGYVNWDLYHQSGIRHASIIAEIIKRHLPMEREVKVLEWGCGPGRVIRHLPDALSQPMKITGTDYNEKTIAWCKCAFPQFQFVVNDLTPPLPINNEVFDVILARSVFTHLSEEAHFKWMTELRRLLHPDGVIILTTQGQFFRDLHLNSEEKSRFDDEQLIVRANVKEGLKWYSAFHPEQFVRDKLLNGLNILEHLPGPVTAMFEQDIWVASRLRNV